MQGKICLSTQKICQALRATPPNKKPVISINTEHHEAKISSFVRKSGVSASLKNSAYGKVFFSSYGECGAHIAEHDHVCEPCDLSL